METERGWVGEGRRGRGGDWLGRGLGPAWESGGAGGD